MVNIIVKRTKKTSLANTGHMCKLVKAKYFLYKISVSVTYNVKLQTCRIYKPQKIFTKDDL